MPDSRRGKNKHKEDKGNKARIVKKSKDPFRVVGGDVTRENEIPWQVATAAPLHMILYKIICRLQY